MSSFSECQRRNSDGKEVNKGHGFNYTLLNLYPDDYLDEYVASLQE